MAGVSSAAQAKVLEELEPRLASASLSLAGELFSVLGTLDSSAGLRRALTDPARESAAKSALLASLVGGKVSAEAEQVADSLAAERWSASRDFGDALETVAATVAIAVAENTAGGAGLEKLENDLFSFNQVVESSHQVQRALGEPQASPEAKAKLALALVPEAGEPAQLLISQAVRSPRGVQASKLVERFATLAAQRQQRWIATVTVSRPLSEDQAGRLHAGLNKLYGRELKVNISVDPTLIGGVRVKVGDEVVDATVIARLGELRRQLAG
ncbi:F-type H+-transporting ATPase subunit delta [Psychromicrobium silvestre]|uniref:ATP synthase subunit delta n=1 Tax=Psychromicrobium silvestre TaxID=1645614 RepID=A0A7Y9LSJ5_9MICC|nr:F0F1 ATP synthase subunit delta [Psychromicrobium silvestre]NYE94802.1 F-type H+-transporting ATPase subunit delta [Psychromicrobium silvestre]